MIEKSNSGKIYTCDTAGEMKNVLMTNNCMAQIQGMIVTGGMDMMLS